MKRPDLPDKDPAGTKARPTHDARSDGGALPVAAGKVVTALVEDHHFRVLDGEDDLASQHHEKAARKLELSPRPARETKPYRGQPRACAAGSSLRCLRDDTMRSHQLESPGNP
jgi:hypothetical protein